LTRQYERQTDGTPRSARGEKVSTAFAARFCRGSGTAATTARTGSAHAIATQPAAAKMGRQPHVSSSRAQAKFASTEPACCDLRVSSLSLRRFTAAP